MKNLSWGSRGQENTEKLLKVLVNHERYPDEKLRAEWKSENPDVVQLSVIYTTKRFLVELVYAVNILPLSAKESSKYKRYIQDSIKRLQILGLLEDKRKNKFGPYSAELKLLLTLPSQASNEIIRYFNEKWYRRSEGSESSGNMQFSYSISSQLIKFYLEDGDNFIQVQINPNSEVVKTLLGTFLKLQEISPNVRSAFDDARNKTLTNTQVDDVIQQQLLSLIELLESEHFEFRFQAAKGLADFEPTAEVIQVLEKHCDAIPVDSVDADQVALSWQLALSLGTLDPEHAKAAIALNRKIDLTEDVELELLTASRIRADGDIDLLIQLYPSLDPYLPKGITLEVLDESGQKILIDPNQTFLEFHTQADDMERTLNFYTAPGDTFQVKISYKNSSFMDSFIA